MKRRSSALETVDERDKVEERDKNGTVIDLTTNSTVSLIPENTTMDSKKECLQSLTLKLANNLNELKSMKEFLFVHNTPRNEWVRVNFVKHVRYLDKTVGEFVSAVHLDTPKFVFVVPQRQRDYLLEHVFGLDENGELLEKHSLDHEIFKKHLNVNYAVFPGLQFRVIEKNEGKHSYLTVSFKSILQCDNDGKELGEDEVD